MIGMISLSITQVNTLSIIWITRKFRFGPAGELCSSLDWPTHYIGGEEAQLADKWTYAKDGGLIKAVWLLEIVILPLACFISCLSIPSVR